MSDNSAIEWTDATWNPIRGCRKVSSGCANCYAEKVAARFSGKGLPYEGLTDNGKWNGTIKVVDDALLQPLKWTRPRKIFVNSMSDLFHENVSDETIHRVFAVMALCPQHTFQVLTKRPERMAEYFRKKFDFDAEARDWHMLLSTTIGGMLWQRSEADDYDRRICHYINTSHEEPHDEDDLERFPRGFDDLPREMPAWPLSNVWLGVSVENQATADERIPHLLRTPAAVRWLSCEPLLGPVDFDAKALHQTVAPGFFGNPLGWFHRGECHKQEGIQYPQINWVVVGGESGAKARPMHPDWARSLRDQCQAAGVAYFFKQWGEWAPSAQFEMKDFTRKAKLDVHEVLYCRDDCSGFDPLGEGYDAKQTMIFRVGKKAAGRVLDGRTWDEMPGVEVAAR